MRILIALPFLLAAWPATAEVVVFAAASLKSALDPIAAGFEAEAGVRVSVSYAGSNTLARQILDGAPADVFVSAAPEWMDEVARAGEIVDGTRVDLLGNRLVLVAHDPQAAPVSLAPGTDLAARLDGGPLAMALVDAVPAGRYGKAALDHLGLWEDVAGAVVQTDNVRAALALVARGEALYGIVYATDARAEPAVHVVATFPEDSHPAITYPAALLRAAADPEDRAFLAALTSDAAAAEFRRQGFAVLGADAR